jgi:hypothetical protein
MLPIILYLAKAGLKVRSVEGIYTPEWLRILSTLNISSRTPVQLKTLLSLSPVFPPDDWGRWQYEGPKTAWFMNALSVSDWPTTDKRGKHLSQIIFLQKTPLPRRFSL